MNDNTASMLPPETTLPSAHPNDLPTFLQLNCFVTVAQLGSFSQAAHQLGVSQPSLSRYVQQLESMIGVPLLERYHRPMTLTPAGQFLLSQTVPIMQNLCQIYKMTQQFAKKPVLTQLNIGFVASILYGLLPEIISQIKQSMPDLEIKLIEISSDQQPKALQLGEIDVGFGRFRYDIPTVMTNSVENGELANNRFIRQVFLRHERFVVAMPITHPLASMDIETGIALKSLLDDTLILYHRTPLPPSHSLLDHLSSSQISPDRIDNTVAKLKQSDFVGHPDTLLHLFASHKLSPKRTRQARDIQIALGLVAAGEGITLVPDSLKTVRTAQIHYHRLYHENATTPIFMNMLATRPHPHIQALLTATYQVYERHGITYSPQVL